MVQMPAVRVTTRTWWEGGDGVTSDKRRGVKRRQGLWRADLPVPGSRTTRCRGGEGRGEWVTSLDARTCLVCWALPACYSPI